MRQMMVVLLLVCGVFIAPQALRAQETQINAEEVMLPMNAEEPVIGRMADEIMDQEKANDPAPVKDMAAAQANVEAPAAPVMDAVPVMDAAPEKNAAHVHEAAAKPAATQHGSCCAMPGMDKDKKRGPSDLVMMNMMMQKMARLKGPNVVATYDGGVVVVNGGKMTKYDDELNVVASVDLKK